MNAANLLRSLVATVVLGSAVLVRSEPVIYQSRPGSKMKLEGTSTVHDWTVESKIIKGMIEFQSEYPLDTAKANPDTKITPKVEVSVPVSSLLSGKTLMDDIMHDALKIKDNPEIKYSLKEWTPKERKAGEPLQFDTKGEITVAGVKKPIEMVVTLTPEGNKLKATGVKELKMTEFGMKPPAPAVGLGLIKTADEVKVTFEWITLRKQDKPTASNN